LGASDGGSVHGNEASVGNVRDCPRVGRTDVPAADKADSCQSATELERLRARKVRL
jgi:hypothetical protein